MSISCCSLLHLRCGRRGRPCDRALDRPWRCLIIFCRIGRTSACRRARRAWRLPRASMSALWSVAALTMRSVETARSFLAFIASFKAALISSRNIAWRALRRPPPRAWRAAPGAHASRPIWSAAQRQTCRPAMNDTQAASQAAAAGWSEPKPTALLVLADGTVIEGTGFGAIGHAVARGMLQHRLGDRPLRKSSPIRPMRGRSSPSRSRISAMSAPTRKTLKRSTWPRRLARAA